MTKRELRAGALPTSIESYKPADSGYQPKVLNGYGQGSNSPTNLVLLPEPLMLELVDEELRMTGNAPPTDCRLARNISEVLLSLYELSPAEPIRTFNERVLSLLHRYIDFESAWLGQASRTQSGPNVHMCHLHNLGPGFLEGYEEIKGSDPLAQLERRGAIDNRAFAMALQNKHIPPQVRDFGSTQNIAFILFAAHPSKVPSRVTHLSLFRGYDHDSYGPTDLLVLQYVIKHVANVLENNRLYWIRAFLESSRYEAVAIFDKSGVLLHAEGPISQIASSEWPEWNGIALPVIAGFRSTEESSGSWAGRCLTIDWRKVEDAFLVGVEALGSIHRLSPRELTIAKIFGEGNTYKQVARQLGISPATVRHHLRQAYGKLAISSKGELNRILCDSAMTTHGGLTAR